MIRRDSDQFYLDAYTGKGGFLDGGYLVQFARESEANFANRKAVSEYHNYVAKALGIYSGFLWKQAPSRETTPLYDAFVQNANGAGMSLDMLLQIQQRLAMLVGTVFVIVDKPARQAASRADDSMPYLATRLPSQVTDFKMGSDGNLERITFCESHRESPWEWHTQYRTFDRFGWQVSNAYSDGPEEVSASGVHDLGRVPVVRLHSTLPVLPTDLAVKAWAHDLCQVNWSLYNRHSEMRWLERSQTFALLMLPAKDLQERERLSKLVIGPNNALPFDPAEGGTPAYLAPPPDPLEAYRLQIDSLVKQIYALVNLEFVGGVQRAGVALSFDFQQCNNGLATLAALVEQAEREIAPLVCAWQGQDWTGSVSYGRDFNLSDLQQALQQAMDALTLDLSPTFNQQLKKQLARQMLGHGIPSDVMARIDGEIEQGADPYGERLQREAMAPPGQGAGV